MARWCGDSTCFTGYDPNLATIPNQPESLHHTCGASSCGCNPVRYPSQHPLNPHGGRCSEAGTVLATAIDGRRVITLTLCKLCSQKTAKQRANHHQQRYERSSRRRICAERRLVAHHRPNRRLRDGRADMRRQIPRGNHRRPKQPVTRSKPGDCESRRDESEYRGHERGRRDNERHQQRQRRQRQPEPRWRHASDRRQKQDGGAHEPQCSPCSVEHTARASVDEDRKAHQHRRQKQQRQPNPKNHDPVHDASPFGTTSMVR